MVLAVRPGRQDHYTLGDYPEEPRERDDMKCPDEDCKYSWPEFVMVLPGFATWYCPHCGKSFRIYKKLREGLQEGFQGGKDERLPELP